MNRWIIALLFVAASSQAQAGGAGSTGASGTIDPGMTRAQVVARLGKPATVRTYQGTTYLLYPNKCGKACGMQDLVILDHDVVVDAVFRSPDRHYTGTSSSPEATRPNSRSQRNQPMQMPAASNAAPDSSGASTTLPTIQGRSTTTSTPADSAMTSTSHPPADSSATSTSRPPADSAPMARPPSAAAPVPYGKPPTVPPPADSARTSTSHPPVDNAASSTSHPPKPPQ